MYHAKWNIPDDMLCKFSPINLPDGVEGLTGELLADLYDLVLSFGIKKDPTAKVHSHKAVMVIIDPNRNNIAIGQGKKGTNEWVSIDLKKGGYLHWDKRLTVEDVIEFINETDKKMEALEFIDPVTKERAKLCVSGKSIQFVMDRIFGDAKLPTGEISEPVLKAMDALRSVIKKNNLSPEDFHKKSLSLVKETIAQLMKEDKGEGLDEKLLQELAGEIFSNSEVLRNISNFDLGLGKKPRGFQKDQKGSESLEVDDVFKVPGISVPVKGRNAEELIAKYDKPEELEIGTTPLGEKVIVLKKDREHNAEREKIINQVLEEKGLSLEDAKGLTTQQILEVKEAADVKMGKPLPSKFEEALAKILPESIVEGCEVATAFATTGAAIVVPADDSPKDQKDKFDKPNEVAIINYAPTGTKLLCHKRDIRYFKRRMRAMEDIFKNKGIGKKVSQAEIQEIRTEIDKVLNG